MKLFRKPVNILIGLMVIFTVLVIEIAQASAAANFTPLTDILQPRRLAMDVSGNIYVTSFENKNIEKINPAGVWLAPIGGINSPSCVAVDSSGNYYINDSMNNRVHKFTSNRVWLTTWGGYGTGNGQFNCPSGIAVDSSGNVYVADSQNNRIQKFNSTGAWLATCGKTDCSSGGLESQFNQPYGIAVDSSGNVYVADSLNHRIQKFESNGNWLATWGGTDCSSGTASGQFDEPRGVALDNSGNVYVADTQNNRIQKLDVEENTWEIWGSAGTGDGQFNEPYGVAVDNSDKIYVADSLNHRIQKFTSAGSFETMWGGWGSGNGQLKQPRGLTIDSEGNVNIVDSGNRRIQKFTATGTYIDKWGMYGHDDGQLVCPVGLTVDSEYNVYIIDYLTKRLQKFNSAGEYLTKFEDTDGTLAGPYDVALDNSNNFYIAELKNNLIQKRSSTWELLKTWGGYGTNPGQFYEPTCIAVYDNYAYITDNMNGRIQKLNVEKNTWETWGSNGHGPGQFWGPVGIAMDIAGNVYVADNNNNRVQMFDSNGNYKAIWGKTDCTAGSAPGQFNHPNGVAVDRSGNVYVGDKDNNRIQVLLAPALKASSTIKGQPVGAGLGTSSLLLGSVEAGSVTITAVQAVGTTGTLFENSDTNAGATVKVVKYAAGSDTSHFETDTPYQDTGVITNGDFFAVKLTEELTDELTSNKYTRNSYYIINVAVSAPAKPIIESATAGSGQVSLNWNAVPGATGYKIYQSTAAGSYGAALATVNEPVYSYDATGLSNGTTYYFVVKAFNSGGDSEASTEVSATPQVAAPGAPALQPPTAGDTYVNLNWAPVTGSAGYKIYQSTASGSYGAERETVGGSVYNYDATGLINGTAYYFVVTAMNPGGDSAYSNEVSATPDPPAAHAVSVAANPTVGGSVSGGGTCNEGSSVTITGTPCNGYYFVNWTENNIQVSTNPSYTFVMGDYGRTLVANFSLISSSDRGDHDSTTSILPINSTTGTALINPAVGGTVSLGSYASLKIPANALRGSDYMKVTVEMVDTSSPAPSGFAIAGTVYRFTVNDREHYDFNRLVTLTFTFDPSQLAPGQTPELYYYEEAEGKWVNIGGTVSGNTITVNVDHFTKYAVMVETSVSPAQKPPVALTDIAGHWAEANINALVTMGAINGNPDGTFKPDNTITRAEFATVLVMAFKLEQKSGHIFNDTSGHWAGEFIATAAADGIVNGYDAGTFGPDDLINREQMAVMIVKAAKLEGTSGETAFADNADITPWAQSCVLSAVKAGIIKGYPNNTFKPQGSATRAEAMTVILNSIGSSDKK